MSPILMYKQSLTLLICFAALFCAAESFGTQMVVVQSMQELQRTAGSPGQVVYLSDYYEPGDKGGGVFVWDASSREKDNQGTVIAVIGQGTGRWLRQSDDVKVTYFGARGDGIRDDTAAIQAAINSVSDTASPGLIFEDGRRVGGTVIFPPGKYRITDTLLVGPVTILMGSGSASGFQRRTLLEGDQGSVIVADFEDPHKWIISSAVFWREGGQAGELIGTREVFGGQVYDQGKVSRTNGIKIRDLLLIGKTNKNGEPPYGGIRLQASPGAVIQGVGVFGVDVAILVNSGWGLSIRDVFSQSYLYGLLALYSVNGLHVDNCYFTCYGSSKRRVTEESVLTGGNHHYFGKLAAGMPDDYAFKRTGILSHYAQDVTLNNVVTEHWDIARYHRYGNISDTGSWLEGNRELGYALINVTFDLRTPNIHAPEMIKEGRFMHLGLGNSVSISQSMPFPIQYGKNSKGETDSRVVVNVPDPDRAGWHYYPEVVHYANARQGVIRVGGEEGADNLAIADTTNHVTIETALRRIAASTLTDWKVIFKAGSTCTLRESIVLDEKNISFVSESNGERPVLIFGKTAGGDMAQLGVRNGGNIQIDGVDIALAPDVQMSTDRVRGLIVLDGGVYAIRVEDSRIDLANPVGNTRSNVSFLERVGKSVVLEAGLSGVRILNGHSIFHEEAQNGSMVNCLAADTMASAGMLGQGINGWGGALTEVLFSNIEAL